MSDMIIKVATQTETFITGKVAVARTGKTYSFDYRVKDGSITLFGAERQIPRNQLKDAHEAVVDHCLSLITAEVDNAFAELDNAEKALAQANEMGAPKGSGPLKSREWTLAFDRREKAIKKAVNADPLRFVRTYPSRAFAYRWMLSDEMALKIEKAETDAEIRDIVGASTLAQDGVSSEPAADVAPKVETAPVSRCVEIRAKLSPALLNAYRYHRQFSQSRAAMLNETNNYGLATAALVLARTDLEYNTPRYPTTDHPEFSAWGPRNKAVRYIPDINVIGIRYVGLAHHIVDMDHQGWLTSENGDNGEIVQGEIYQLPGRNGKPIFVAGHSDPNNDSAATIDFGTLYTGTPDGSWDAYGARDKRDAARAADDMARRYGEEETEHGRHWQAGARFVDIGCEHSEARKATLAALREFHGSSSDSRRAFVTSRHLILSAYLKAREEFRNEQAKLEAGHGGTPGFREHVEN